MGEKFDSKFYGSNYKKEVIYWNYEDLSNNYQYNTFSNKRNYKIKSKLNNELNEKTNSDNYQDKSQIKKELIMPNYVSENINVKENEIQENNNLDSQEIYPDNYNTLNQLNYYSNPAKNEENYEVIDEGEQLNKNYLDNNNNNRNNNDGPLSGSDNNSEFIDHTEQIKNKIYRQELVMVNNKGKNNNENLEQNEEKLNEEDEKEEKKREDNRLNYVLNKLGLDSLSHIFEGNHMSFNDILFLSKEDLNELNFKIFQKNRLLSFIEEYSQIAKTYSLSEIKSFFGENHKFDTLSVNTE